MYFGSVAERLEICRLLLAEGTEQSKRRSKHQSYLIIAIIVFVVVFGLSPAQSQDAFVI